MSWDEVEKRIAELEAVNWRLRARTDLFDVFLARTPAAVAMFDRAMRYLAYSTRWLIDYHLGEQDLHGRSHYEVFPDVPERWKAIHRRVLAGEAMSAVEDRFDRADGSVDWVTWECVPWHLDDGTVGGIIMFTEVVTAQVQARIALEGSEEKYRRLYESMMDAFVRMDMDGFIAESNHVFQTMLGYTPAELASRTNHDLTPPRWHDEEVRILSEQVMARGFSELYEKEYIRRDGSRLPVELRMVLLRDNADMPIGLWAIVRDISERKQKEAALRETAHELDRVFNLSLDLLCIANTDGYFLRINPAWQETLGYSLEDLEGRRFLDFVHPDDLQATIDAIGVLAEGKDILNFTNRYQRRDGTYRWIEWLSKPYQGGLIYAAARDITERKQSEQALWDSRQMLQNVLDNFPGVVFWKDRESVYLGCNKAFAWGAGLTDPTEIVGKTDYDLPWAHTEAQAYRDDDREVIMSERPKAHIEETQLQADGRIRALDTTKLPLRNAVGEVIGVFGSGWDVTERKQAEDALADSERMRTYILNTVPQSIFWKNRESVYLGCNDVLARAAGLTHPEEIVGKDDTVLPWSRRAAAYRADDQEVMTTNTPKRHIVEPLRRADGSRIWIETTKIPMTDSEGRVYGVLGVFDDITERKRATEELAESRMMLQLVLDTIPVRVFWKDTHERYLGCNTLLAHDAGFSSPAEMIGKNDYDLTWRDRAELYQQDDQRVMASGEAKLNYEEPQTTPNGDQIWLRTSKIPLRDAEDRIIGILGVYEDVTERKFAEQALEKERALLSTGIDILPFPIIFETSNGEISRVNRAATELYAPRNVGMAEAIREIQLLDPVTRQVIPQEQWPEQRALRGEVTASAEYLLVMPDGRELPILTQSAPIYVREELIGVVVALQDIAKLKETDQAKDQFLMVLSHELKTPLTSILGWAQAALQMPDKAPQALGVVVRSAHEQSRILEDLLDVSRLVTGRLSLRLEVFDLWQLAHMSVESFAQSARTNGLTLHESPPTEPLLIDADIDRLRQAIGNLLTNAIKFTDAGGAIHVCAYRQGEEAVLEIHDTGQGIEPDKLPSLFQPFMQLRREEQKGGLGLGLSLVKGIIELHGGRVTADSPGLGHGSTFTITIPLRPA